MCLFFSFLFLLFLISISLNELHTPVPFLPTCVCTSSCLSFLHFLIPSLFAPSPYTTLFQLAQNLCNVHNPSTASLVPFCKIQHAQITSRVINESILEFCSFWRSLYNCFIRQSFPCISSILNKPD